MFFIVSVVFFIGLQLVLNALLAKKKSPLLPPVTLSVSQTADVPVYFSAIGTVTAEDTVTVKTQINGTLTRVNVKDGQVVKTGDVLAQIDSRIYQAQMLQYQGALLRDQALLANAQRDLLRYQNLYRTKAVSQQTLNTQESLVQQYKGAVEIDQGQFNAAQTNFAYCTITSPVMGRIGIVAVDPGNFVQTSDTNGIAVLTTLDPIDIIFPLPEKDVGAVAIPFDAGNTLSVIAYDQNREKIIATGQLIAIDNQVNLSTGTVNFKAVFKNTDKVLFPNQFVNVKMLVNTLKQATIVPTAAIQEGNDGAYVYRYNKNHTVTYVPVKAGVTYQQNTVITEGVSPGESVVTQGADKLFNGAKVSVSGNGAP